MAEGAGGLPGATPTSAPAAVPGVRRQFLTFALIGVGGLLVDMAALWLAMNPLTLDPYTGRVFSYLCAASVTWWLNREFTFIGASRRGAIRQWGRFLAANAVGAAVNYTVYVAVLTLAPLLLPDLAPGLKALIPYAGVAAGSICGLVFNFTLSRLVVFKAG